MPKLCRLRVLTALQEERDSFSKYLIGGGFTDAWRRQHPEVTGYTYWNYRFNTRASNKGWRLDYFLVWHCPECPALPLLPRKQFLHGA